MSGDAAIRAAARCKSGQRGCLFVYKAIQEIQRLAFYH